MQLKSAPLEWHFEFVGMLFLLSVHTLLWGCARFSYVCMKLSLLIEWHFEFTCIFLCACLCVKLSLPIEWHFEFVGMQQTQHAYVRLKFSFFFVSHPLWHSADFFASVQMLLTHLTEKLHAHFLCAFVLISL